MLLRIEEGRVRISAKKFAELENKCIFAVLIITNCSKKGGSLATTLFDFLLIAFKYPR